MCAGGTVLFMGLCRTDCPEGYFIAIDSNYSLSYSCDACSSSCESCDGDSEYDCLTCS